MLRPRCVAQRTTGSVTRKAGGTRGKGRAGGEGPACTETATRGSNVAVPPRVSAGCGRSLWRAVAIVGRPVSCFTLRPAAAG